MPASPFRCSFGPTHPYTNIGTGRIMICIIGCMLFISVFSQIGDQVCVKRSVAEPRYAWGGETHHSVGSISETESDGVLIIEIPNRPIPWQADRADMEKVESFKEIFQ